SKNQEQLIKELERIVAEGTDDNEEDDKSEHAIKPRHFINGNDGLRKNDSGTQLQATDNGETNPEINTAKISANTPSNYINGSYGLGENSCGTQLQAATNENEHLNHRTIDNTGNEDNNEQVNDNRIGGQQQQNNQGSNNETQYEQDSANNKPGEIGSPHTTHSEQELRNPKTTQPKGQPPLITTPPELEQVKWKVSVPNKSFGSPEARAKSDTLNHSIPQFEQRKKADVAPVTVDKSAKHSKGNNINGGSK
ncbi:MAG: hypothetical protein EZS28_053108, partial [Streblomastix strix]